MYAGYTCGITFLEHAKLHTCGKNVYTMEMRRQQKNASHTDWSTSEIPQQEHSREGTVMRKMEQTEIFCNVCVSRR